MSGSVTFGRRLSKWRKRRGLSQLELALAAACSQRHVSFLELDRTQPSRDMVLRLSDALDLPLRQSNALLLAAGFAPVWAESDLSAEALAPIRQALNFMLTQQEPFPAVVVDRRWNLLQANTAATKLVTFLTGPIAAGTPINLADALVAPDILRPYLMNWPDVVAYFIRTIEADENADSSQQTAELLARLKTYPDVSTIRDDQTTSLPDGPVLPMHFEKNGTHLHLFTTVATLGTPQDITLQELRIECFFPMDDATADVFRAWAAERGTEV
ncbi:MAG: helix-turn-helix domain-containing protein [Pseudomonadota bacterium]